MRRISKARVLGMAQKKKSQIPSIHWTNSVSLISIYIHIVSREQRVCLELRTQTRNDKCLSVL